MQGSEAARIRNTLIGMATGLAGGAWFGTAGMHYLIGAAGNSLALDAGLTAFFSQIGAVCGTAAGSIAGLKSGWAIGHKLDCMPSSIERRISRKLPGWVVSVNEREAVARLELSPTASAAIHYSRVRATAHYAESYFNELDPSRTKLTDAEIYHGRTPAGWKVTEYPQMTPEVRRNVDMIQGALDFPPSHRLLSRLQAVFSRHKPDQELHALLGLNTIGLPTHKLK